MSAAALEARKEPGALASALLAALVHAALFALLVFGVRWQNPPPEPVLVELWAAPPDPAPAPKAEPPPPPSAEPAPAPTAAPRIERPDIELKAPSPKPKPEPAKPLAPPQAQKAPPKADATKTPSPEDDARRRLQEELLREQQALAAERERAALRENLAREAAAANARALAAWIERIRAKIRGNILLPPDLKGNPEAIFDVVQLPTGEVLSVRLRKSSGHAGYDQAVERAILKSSPLPRPDRPELFQRELELRFRPLER
ncbi:MAG: TonB C-terminal domain-containing protein [Burkholderiales bacterium]|nr:TonB C-terminal domain-containing protein [Burkholderiales bacterium]